MTIREFFAQFPDDESCLQHIFECKFGQGHTCPKCEREAKWYRIKAERAYSCQFCGHHLHPTVDTPFHRTRTPLQLWFFAIYLFTTTRNGVSAKELQRQLGVTYKTAWRMGHEIRKHMAWVDGDPTLAGTVEVDETYVGGKTTSAKRWDNKGVVFGMLQRDGKVVARVVPFASKGRILPLLKDGIAKGSTIYSDESHVYTDLERFGYTRDTVNHSKKEYVDGPCHTNGIESFWSHLKKGLTSTHVAVSETHLEKYVKEFECRFNFRQNPKEMFPALVSSFLRPEPSPQPSA
ncbi:transposase [Haloferula helveola]|uniref:Transposase n=1 Tax=Haloferula helveola TaxID=490095 RepID=A0ABM7RG27_9BACT|nr:transposase [Haloferula helveola]